MNYYTENRIYISSTRTSTSLEVAITTNVGAGEFDYFDRIPVEIRVYN